MVVAAKDYYDILGVGRDADPNTIKRAFRKLAVKYHPGMFLMSARVPLHAAASAIRLELCIEC